MINLTEEQAKAVDAIAKWYYFKNNEPLVVVGAGGTGKSSIISTFIEILGLSSFTTAFVTFTGKAASVLIKKGNKRAKTIHQLIYDPELDKDGNIIGFKKKQRLTEALNLIVVDEYYMVDDAIMTDILSYGVPVICLGDKYQLPPPSGKINSLAKRKPDIELTQILRQAKDSPIIYLATKARNHERIRVGNYGDNVRVISKDSLTSEDLKFMMTADQIICGKNDTVKKLNNFYRRKFLKIDPELTLPQLGEKLICLRNNWNIKFNVNNFDINLVNGLGLKYIKHSAFDGPDYNKFDECGSFYAVPDFAEPSDITISNISLIHYDGLAFKYGLFSDAEIKDEKNIAEYGYAEVLKKRKYFGSMNKSAYNNYNLLNYGYAITTHKSQGSSWNKVFLLFEPFSSPSKDLYWQQLYTGISRAETELVLAI